MSTVYLKCPQCGGRALAVATRCPHCGFAFPSPPLHERGRQATWWRPTPALLIGGALLAMAALAVLVAKSAPRGGTTGAADGTSAQTTPPAAGASGGGSTVGSGTAAGTTRLSDSASASAPSPPASASARVRGSPPSAPTPAAPESESAVTRERLTRTWANVRSGRTMSAPPVVVLRPGDTVQVDSLRRGWYRVMVDSRAIGYIHRSTLADLP